MAFRQDMEKTAKDMIKRFGGKATFIRNSGEPKIPGKPWEGGTQFDRNTLSAYKLDAYGFLFNADERSADDSKIFKGDVVLLVVSECVESSENWDCVEIDRCLYSNNPITYEFVLSR